MKFQVVAFTAVFALMTGYAAAQTAPAAAPATAPAAKAAPAAAAPAAAPKAATPASTAAAPISIPSKPNPTIAPTSTALGATTAPASAAIPAKPAAAKPAPETPEVTAAAAADAVAKKKAADAAPTQYAYIHNEGEYSITLPSAPTATTIWGDQDDPIPYLEKPPRFGSIGEKAVYRRVNEDSGEFIDVQITFLKADRDFLLTRTPDNMRATLENEVKGMLLDNKKFTITNGTGTVKQASLTGFSVDKDNNALYNAFFYLTGNSTITVVKVQYSIENKLYNAQYQQMLRSIMYIGK